MSDLERLRPEARAVVGAADKPSDRDLGLDDSRGPDRSERFPRADETGSFSARLRRPWVVDVLLVGLALLDAVSSAGHEGGAALTVSVVAALGLSLRRRWPYLAFAAALPALFTAYVLIAPLVALYTITVSSRSRGPVVVGALLTATGYFLPWPLSELDWHWHPGDFLGLIYTAVYVATPIALGYLSRARQSLADRLDELEASQRREHGLTAERALSMERARLAREMHDAVSHQVSLIAQRARALSAVAADERARESAQTIRQLSIRTLDELRHMVDVLRKSDSGAHAAASLPTIDLIPRLVAENDSNITVDLVAVRGRRWSPTTEHAAFRTVQEALTNVRKHAAGAAATVRLTPHGTGLRVVVRNDTPPAAPVTTEWLPGGNGLIGLRERAERLGGSLVAEPTPDGGFVLEAILPDA